MMMAVSLGDCSVQWEALQVPGRGLSLILSHFVESIHLKFSENLSPARARPENLDARDGLGLAQPNFLAERGGAEAAAGADGLIIAVFTGGALDNHVDPGSNRRAVGFDPFEFERDPVVAMPRVQVQNIMVNITTDGAAHIFVDILVAVIIDIAKRNSVPLLQVAEPARARDVLESLAPIVAKHAVGDDCFEVGVASAKVKIKEPIVIEIAEVGAHSQEDMV